MKLESYSFCTSNGVSIDDKDVTAHTETELREVINKVLNSFDKQKLESVVKDLIDNYSTNREDFGDCDQCGDYSYVDVLEIKELHQLCCNYLRNNYFLIQ